MSRICATADLHLGAGSSHAQPIPGSALTTRDQDYLNAFGRVLETARDCDAILLAGDMYDSAVPSPTLQAEFASRIRKAASNTEVFMCVGNHDHSVKSGSHNPTDLFTALQVSNVTVFRTPGVKFNHDESLIVAALPWLPKQRLLAEQKGFIDPGELARRMAQVLVEQLYDLAEQAEKLRDGRDIPVVLMLHWSIEGGSTGAWAPRGVAESEVVIPLAALQNPTWDLVIAGHLHLPQVVSRGPVPVLYTGSPERITFNEEKEERSFVVADLERGNCQWSFHSTGARPFRTFDLGETSDPVASLAEHAAKANGAICRVKYSLPPGVAAPSDREMRKALLDVGAAHVATITRERPVRELRAQSREVAIAQTPVEALDAYLATRNDLGASQSRIRELGVKLIEEQLTGTTV